MPIAEHRDRILSLILHNRVTVICGETGCGKTTQVPQYLYSHPRFRRIMVTQPRRISAITLAERVSHELNVECGAEVGYSVRFQEKRSPHTRIVFMTDGMAIREMMLQKHYDVTILDEAHERSVNTDVLMALLRAQLEKGGLESKMRLVIMSATIESARFLEFFGSSSLVRVSGRTFPTQVHYLLEPTSNYLDTAYNTLMQIHCTQPPGDILVFMSGEQEILALQKKIVRAAEQFAVRDLQVLTLYSALPHEYQRLVFERADPRTRRVILATNIAETSVTIAGLRYVVDTGFMKMRIYNANKGVDMLAIVPVSKANAVQRAGRAGREREGLCFRLYTKNDYEDLKEQVTP